METMNSSGGGKGFSRKNWIAVVLVVAVVLIAAAPKANAQAHATWTDPATGLMWAKDTNSSTVNWNQASNYCSNLRLAGHSDWRLPTIDELGGIYDSHVKPVRRPCIS